MCLKGFCPQCGGLQKFHRCLHLDNTHEIGKTLVSLGKYKLVMLWFHNTHPISPRNGDPLVYFLAFQIPSPGSESFLGFYLVFFLSLALCQKTHFAGN